MARSQPKPKINLSTPWRIVEDSDGTGWTVMREDANVRRETASEALEYVKERQRVEITDRSNDGNIVVVTWEPKTKIGRAVVSVLSS